MELEETHLRWQPPPSLSPLFISLCSLPVTASHSPCSSPSFLLSLCIPPSRSLSFVSNTCCVPLSVYNRRREEAVAAEARSPSFISPHEGNIIEISLQEGCANTTTTPAHYRAVRRLLSATSSPLSLTLALSSAISAKDLLTPHASKSREEKHE